MRSAPTALSGRLIPQVSDNEQAPVKGEDACEALDNSLLPPSLHSAVLAESRFYRVLHESKLYSIDFDGVCNVPTFDNTEAKLDAVHQRALSLAKSDYKAVRIQELARANYGRTASAKSRYQMLHQERNGA